GPGIFIIIIAVMFRCLVLCDEESIGSSFCEGDRAKFSSFFGGSCSTGIRKFGPSLRSIFGEDLLQGESKFFYLLWCLSCDPFFHLWCISYCLWLISICEHSL